MREQLYERRFVDEGNIIDADRFLFVFHVFFFLPSSVSLSDLPPGSSLILLVRSSYAHSETLINYIVPTPGVIAHTSLQLCGSYLSFQFLGVSSQLLLRGQTSSAIMVWPRMIWQNQFPLSYFPMTARAGIP
jgi:hypothetical protein